MTDTKNMQKTNLIVATFPKSCTGTSDIDISDKKTEYRRDSGECN